MSLIGGDVYGQDGKTEGGESEGQTYRNSDDSRGVQSSDPICEAMQSVHFRGSAATDKAALP